MENETLKDVILQLAALSGEVSEEALRDLDCSDKYLTNLLWQLRNEQVIKRCDKDGTVGYRLSQSGKKYLRTQYPERYGDYFGKNGITSKVRLDTVHRQRCHRMSEMNVLLHNAGVNIYPGCKPPFQQSILPQSSQSLGYTSYEFKDIGDLVIKMKPSRAVGVIVQEKKTILLYNSHEKAVKWEDMTEYRARTVIGKYCSRPVSTVMSCVDMDGAYELLTSTGGELNRYYHITDKQPNMYFLPQKPEGVFLLRFTHLSDCSEHLKERLLAEMIAEEHSNTSHCDGFLDRRTPVLYACDFDMVRLHGFYQYLDVSGNTGLVFCLDFQVPVLERYFGNTVTIRVLNTKATADLFGIPYGGKGG